MSEEAKEKAGGGKAAHRKKKGKKVGERKRLLCLSAFSFCSVVALAQQNQFHALEWEVGFLDGVMGDVEDFHYKVFAHVFFFIVLSLVHHLS